MIKNLIVLIALLSCFSAKANDNIFSKVFDRHEAAFVVGMEYNDVKAEKFAPTVGLSLFPTKYLGFRGTTSIAVNDATALNNGEFVGLVRVPVWILSPYVGGGAIINTSRGSEWSSVALAGVEARISKRWGVFTEAKWNLGDKSTTLNDYSLRGGLNLRFW